MKRALVAAGVLVVLSAVPASAVIVTRADTAYDIESNHAVGVYSFRYQRSSFDGSEYKFEVTAVLHPYDWLSATTYQDSWSGSIDRAASANDYVYSMISVQQYDLGSGQYIDSGSGQSDGISIPIRSLLVVYEDWDGWMHLDSAKWVVFGAPYSYTALDYPDLVFTGWGGNVQSTNRSISGTVNEEAFTLVAAYTRPAPPPQTPPGDQQNPNDGSNCPQYQNCNSPIVLNLGGGGYQLSGKNDPVVFDIDADGKPDRLAWTARNAPMAFLAFDRNHNRVIDDGSELFGNHTPLATGAAASNGFDALAQYDSNVDGNIDANDPIWLSLLLWTDWNHDGVSQPSEIRPLSDSEVTAIGLRYHWTGRHDVSGNAFRYESRVWIGNGGRRSTPHPVYDIFFVSAP